MSQGKIPSEETGTYSTHFGTDDQNIINKLGWEGLGPGPILTRSLEKSEELHDLKKTYRRFLQDDIGLGRLMRELNQL